MMRPPAYRTFLLGKNNEADGRQDALAADAGRGLFAVADGVSNSCHPELVSRALCGLFVVGEPSELDHWEEYVAETLMPAVTMQWRSGVEARIESSTGRIQRHEALRYRDMPFGASTFTGVHVDVEAGYARFAVIGDSTLFVIGIDGQVEAINTDRMVGERTDYSNMTYAVMTNGCMAGRWRVGGIPLRGVAMLALMTDGMAKWFEMELASGSRPDRLLWTLPEDPESFKELASSCREREAMDDDLAVVLIELSEACMDNVAAEAGEECAGEESEPVECDLSIAPEPEKAPEPEIAPPTVADSNTDGGSMSAKMKATLDALGSTLDRIRKIWK